MPLHFVCWQASKSNTSLWPLKTTLTVFCGGKPIYYMSLQHIYIFFTIGKSWCKSQRVSVSHGVAFTRLRARSWPRLSRWRRRSVTFCGTWWLPGLSSWWDADKCQSGGTWGTSPFSSGCRPAAGLLQNSLWWAGPRSSWWPSWCCSRCWPDGQKNRKGWRTAVKQQLRQHGCVHIHYISGNAHVCVITDETEEHNIKDLVGKKSKSAQLH